jgi:queuine tRNA-ribosyltransferase
MVKHFNLMSTDGPARRGEIVTTHGKIATPAFMPVGSQAGVKTLTPEEVKDVGADILLSNAYHLYLRPGADIIRRAGGLHNFMGWDRPILTDSGGFQVFSLATLRRVNDDGVVFRSHIDGSEHRITPESITVFQELLGSDIMMALDECPAHDAPLPKQTAAVRRTTEWAGRCLAARRRDDTFLYGIVQGGLHRELRQESVAGLTELDFPGYGIGGLSLGETKEQTFNTVAATTELLPVDRTRYLMGVGAPDDIIEAVNLGCDIFDSVLPTRVARHGAFYTRLGRQNIGNARYKDAMTPLEPDCDCYACRHFSAAYLRHLFRAKELLSLRLLTIHNLRFLSRLTADCRQSIENGGFQAFRHEFLDGYTATNEEIRLAQKAKWRQRHGF